MLKNLVKLPEYKTTLPSGTEIKYRPFVVKEEKLLLIAKESKNEQEIYSCIRNIIKNCVTEPEIFDVDKLPYYDAQFLFVKLRCKSMGESVQIRVTDPETKQTFDTNMDLDKIIITNITTQSKLKTIKLNDSLAVEFKYPTFGEYATANAFDNLNNKLNVVDAILKLSSLCVSKVYTKTDTIDCSQTTKEEIIEFIDSLPKEEFNKFCEFFKTMPKLQYKSEFTNPSTGNTFPVEVSDFTNFFILS